MFLIDSHCHFDDTAFDNDRSDAYQRARHAGVAIQIVPAVCARLWPTLREVVQKYPGLFASYGLHPMYLAEHQPEHLELLRLWLERERPVAVGECGLDYFVTGLNPEKQLDYFTAQLQAACDYDLPVIIHARRAVDPVLKYLRRYPVRGVIHSFSGSLQQAQQVIERGLFISVGGPVTYPRAHRLRQLIATLPLEALLLETDSPDQPGVYHRGQRNEPAYLSTVLETIAKIRDQDPVSIATITTRNAMTLFNLSDSVNSL